MSICINGLLLQYCHVSVSIPFGPTFYTHRKCGLHSHLSRHITYIRGILPSCHYGILHSWFLAAQISASVWIFKSAFHNQLQISLACVVSGISLKN